MFINVENKRKGKERINACIIDFPFVLSIIYKLLLLEFDQNQFYRKIICKLISYPIDIY